MSNREIITEAIVRYMQGLPEPKTLPAEIRVAIRFEEATEVHHISVAAPREEEKSADAAARIVALYHEICRDLPKVRVFTESRKRAVRARLKKYSVEDFTELFKKAQESDFLCGRNDRKWSANFDWLLNESNMAKVLEGNYDNKRAGSPRTAPQSFNVDSAFAKAMERSYKM